MELTLLFIELGLLVITLLAGPAVAPAPVLTLNEIIVDPQPNVCVDEVQP